MLLDIDHLFPEQGRPMVFDRRDTFGVDDLEQCAGAQGVDLRERDVLLFGTGWTAGYQQADEAKRRELAETVDWSAPG